MKKIIFTTLLLLALTSCKKEKTDVVSTIEFGKPLNTALTLSQFVKNQQQVLLETTPESLMGEISKVIYADSLIFIKSNHAIYIFYTSGKFIRKVDHSGSGPTEYTRLSDFDIDKKNNEIIIFDKGKRELLYYNFNGEYRKNVPLNFWAIKFKTSELPETVFYSGNETSENENTNKFTVIRNGEKVKSYFSINKQKSKYLHINGYHNFYSNNSKHYFFELFNDTVYVLNKENEFSPAYKFSFNNSITPDFFEKPYSNIMDFFDELKKKNFSYGISAFTETSKFIFISYFSNNKPCYGIYNRENNLTTSSDNVADDISFNNASLSQSEDGFVFWPFQNRIIYFLEQKWIADNKSSIKSSPLFNSAYKADINNNPVMVIAELK